MFLTTRTHMNIFYYLHCVYVVKNISRLRKVNIHFVKSKPQSFKTKTLANPLNGVLNYTKHHLIYKEQEHFFAM